MALLHPENTRGGNRQSINHLYNPIRPQPPLEIAPDGPKHAPRRRLTDITNLMPEIPNPNFPTADKNDYTQLLKENSALLRILSEKNRVIEQANLEVQKLRMTVSKLQTQNWQLAQANSQMLVELNMGKDKLKALKHELGCTEQALRTKSLELENEKMGNRLSSEVGNEDERQLGACNESTRDKPHLGAEKLKLPKRKRTSDENLNNTDNIPKEREMEMLNVSSTTMDQVVEEEKGNKKQKQSKRSQASVSKSQVLEIKAQKTHAQPQNLLCQDQAVHTVSSNSSSSVDASNLEKDRKVGTAPPVSKCGGGKSENKRCTRNCPGNLKSDKDRPHLNESAQGIDQTAQFKSTSPCSISIMVEGTEKRNHEEQMAFSRGMEEVQLHLNCNNADPCTDSAMTEKNEEQNQGVEETVSSNEKKKLQNEEVRRFSGTGRPSRRATIGKSYKEKPLNVKMRRD